MVLDMPLCRLWKAKCARCDTLALHAREAEVHSMQWSPDILEDIWDKVRTGMWRARMKAHLWTEVHKELMGLFDDCDNCIDIVLYTIKEKYYEKSIFLPIPRGLFVIPTLGEHILQLIPRS